MQINLPSMKAAKTNGLWVHSMFSNGQLIWQRSLAHLLGSTGVWIGGYDQSRLYVNSNTGTPVTGFGQQVGYVQSKAGGSDLSQNTASLKPYFARQPVTGIRNLAVGAQNTDTTTYWYSGTSSNGITVTRTGNGIEDNIPYVEYRYTGNSTQGGIRSPFNSAASEITVSLGEVIFGRVEAKIVDGFSQLASDEGVRMDVTERNSSGVQLDNLTSSLIRTQEYSSLQISNTIDKDTVRYCRFTVGLRIGIRDNVDITIRIRSLQFERGSLSPLQRNYSPYDVTEEGIESLPYILNDGGDIHNISLSGTSGVASLSTDGEMINENTVATTLNTIRHRKQVDAIIRPASPFTSDELYEIYTYWKSKGYPIKWNPGLLFDSVNGGFWLSASDNTKVSTSVAPYSFNGVQADQIVYGSSATFVEPMSRKSEDEWITIPHIISGIWTTTGDGIYNKTGTEWASIKPQSNGFYDYCEVTFEIVTRISGDMRAYRRMEGSVNGSVVRSSMTTPGTYVIRAPMHKYSAPDLGLWLDSNNFVGSIRNVKFRYKKQRSAEQETSSNRPVYGCMPSTGIRNIAPGAQLVTNSTYWPNSFTSNGLTATKLETGSESGVPYVIYRIQGISTATSFAGMYAHNNSLTLASQGEIYYSQIMACRTAGSNNGISSLRAEVAIVDVNGSYVTQIGSQSIILSTSYQKSTSGGVLSAANTHRVRTAIAMSTTVGATIDITIKLKGLQFERGSATSLQYNYGPYWITEQTVKDSPYFYNGGNSSFNTTLEAGYYSYIIRDLGGSNITGTLISDGLTPSVLPVGNRTRDILVRKGTFNSLEMDLLEQYWRS